jgi:hypothetical protein
MPDVHLTTSNIPSTVYGGQWDHLPIPGGGTIGKTADTQVLRKLFARMNIEGAHRDGRETLCGRYAALLREIGGQASDKAIMEFLRQYEDETNAGV